MRIRDDRGAATVILMAFMALALTAATFIFSRIAHANDLRTKAQQAADAAALAAVSEIRDRGAYYILSEIIPYAAVFLPSSVAAAQAFALRNGSLATSVLPTGVYGHTVRASVRTNSCQTNFEVKDPLKRIPCRKGDLNTKHGTATAYAEVTFPICYYVYPTGLYCNGRKVYTLEAARDLFNIKLVDGPALDRFDPSVFEGGGVTTGKPAQGGGPVISGSNRQIGQKLAAQMGWTGQEWNCLDQLWQHESGWNHTARNPSSGALGIPQALPASKMATAGPDYMTNPATQIKWGLGYIRQRYGSPCAAWTWWQRTDRRPYPGHWY